MACDRNPPDWLYGLGEHELSEMSGLRGVLTNMLRLRHDSIEEMFRRRTLSCKQFSKMIHTNQHHKDAGLFDDDRVKEMFQAVHAFNNTPVAGGIDFEEFSCWLNGDDEEARQAACVSIQK